MHHPNEDEKIYIIDKYYFGYASKEHVDDIVNKKPRSKLQLIEE